MNICPICHQPYFERPALSRRDGKTDICPACGTREALEDFAGASKPKITSTSDHIRVEGHRGTWYVIDEGIFNWTPDVDGEPVTIPVHAFLLEHETYGDEASNIIVDENGSLMLDDVWNGFDDLLEAGWERADENTPG